MPIKVNWADIVKLLQQGEGATLEFIPHVKNSKDLTKVIIGFANAQGGTIVAGIDDKNGHLNGVDVSKEWVTTVCKTECEPAINAQVGEFLRNEKKIIVIQVKEGNNKPYRTNDGDVLTREGVKTREASIEEQKELNPWGVGGINPRQKKALNFITDNVSISNKQYRELSDVSHKTAHVELTELVEKGVLRVEGQGRSTAYVLAQGSIVASSTTQKVEAGEQSLPSNGQLFHFEEVVDDIMKPAGKIEKKDKVVVKRERITALRQTKLKDKEGDFPTKEDDGEVFEPPIKPKEETFNKDDNFEKDEVPVIAGDDYEDTRPTAKAPEIDDDKEEDASSANFLDL